MHRHRETGLQISLFTQVALTAVKHDRNFNEFASWGAQMSRLCKLLLSVTATFYLTTPALAQDAGQVMGPFIDMMNKAIAEQARQQELERLRNSPEFRNQEVQPGGLTRGQVIIVQQLLTQRGYDVGAPDGIIGPKTMAVVAQLQAKVGQEVNGYPTKLLLDALLQGQ
jgi:hypothetical protein